ncbi:uncharacterized protein LOC113235837 isoform X2 [Hyposmocoma kahamanoa]|uniref:uncharacterized protein LOC113235837 isoform X2 n=1 Tax=Hyposmocoma kahamanoa TaxID=1477025 RepID=UPI000E6D7391|nr:uncharacterized protein LOC113235837 isoform X2 [Hyposmocoma kahamanoa]
MAGKSVSFNTVCDLTDSNIESIAKWLSCNGEVWGVGPTAVFASAAALFLYQELESTIFIAGDGAHVSLLEKTLISTMVAGMLALMIHLWVCSMRFFQYYLDTLIRDSPSMLLEMTTAGLLGTQADMVPLGPLTRFLRQQQPQIHITVCWFLSLCYADYVRKNYCQRFNMPYLEQWQAQLHERASRGVKRTIEKVNSFVGSVHQRLRGFAPATPSQTTEVHTESAVPKATCGANSKVWMGGTRASLSECGMSSGSLTVGKELCVRLVSQSSETTADAIEKLRTYITTTRCSCSGPQKSCLSGPCNSAFEEKKSKRLPLETSGPSESP